MIYSIYKLLFQIRFTYITLPFHKVEIHHLQQMSFIYFLHARKQEYRATLGHKLDYVLQK